VSIPLVSLRLIPTSVSRRGTWYAADEGAPRRVRRWRRIRIDLKSLKTIQGAFESDRGSGHQFQVDPGQTDLATGSSLRRPPFEQVRTYEITESVAFVAKPRAAG
jgi:hypothetical protein